MPSYAFKSTAKMGMPISLHMQ